MSLVLEACDNVASTYLCGQCPIPPCLTAPTPQVDHIAPYIDVFIPLSTRKDFYPLGSKFCTFFHCLAQVSALSPPAANS